MLTSLSFSLITDVFIFSVLFQIFFPWTSTLSFFHASTSHLLIRLPGSNLSMTSWQTNAVKSRTINPKGRGKSAKVKSPPDHPSFEDGFHQPTLTLTRRRERKKDGACDVCSGSEKDVLLGKRKAVGILFVDSFGSAMISVPPIFCYLVWCRILESVVRGSTPWSRRWWCLDFFSPILYLLKSNSAIVLFRCRDRDCSFVGANMMKSKR